MRWSDSAILLTVRKTDRGMLVLELFTENYGRQRGALDISSGPAPALPPGCRIDVELTKPDDASTDALGELTIHEISGGVSASKESDIGFLCLTCMKYLLSKLLPEREPYHELYQATTHLIGSLAQEDGRWPVAYATWEMALLNALDIVSGLERCLPDFRQGEPIYISPTSGRVVSRLEAGAFIDRLLPVPGFLMGGRNTNIRDVREGLRMTRLMLERFAFPKARIRQMPKARAALVEHAASIRKLPPAKSRPLGVEEVDGTARRVAVNKNPLMVGGRC